MAAAHPQGRQRRRHRRPRQGQDRRGAARAAGRETGRWCAASTWCGATSARRAREQGGIITKEMPIHLSNIALAEPTDGKPTRVGFRFVEGRKVRYRQADGRTDRWLRPNTSRG